MTRLVRFSNNAVSRLAANLSSSGLSVSLTPGDGSKFPSLTGSQFFMATLVKADGTVADSKVDKSSGFKNLDKAAQKGLSGCKFKPGTKDGAPAQTWTKVDYAWKLD